MIGRLNHVAIVVPDLAAATYADMLGATVSRPMDLPAHGVHNLLVATKERHDNELRDAEIAISGAEDAWKEAYTAAWARFEDARSAIFAQGQGE